MHGFLASMVLLLAATGASAAPEHPRLEPSSPRKCVDAKGRMAVCGVDPSAWHACYGADSYGRCPGDPRCFDGAGAEVRCVRPVVTIAERCMARAPTGGNDLAAALARAGWKSCLAAHGERP
jgi:hypothetical protein